ncbi:MULTISPECIES: glycosyltransferase family 4 protein [unclassified Paenibacillus]|uniref:glycosyltransferase family 4 protein n=1 Tax=unclassified Paenibacillus TaxID=185978 RepID=UPI001AE61AAD|nr:MULTISPECIES: glycosyltransferase family 4 protein [unclassified Paenibacillus]MBP1153350.1 glycosyltransferase involved in cell wall biosynthesis [Paenibacillus sp. PvP091]MBP1171267.1 glycosyltransferase involved in cell wall biosynthesis [Paenibacillus sp. PvR098]MBP2442295.1 glycosyltransferase involved in cell wall biosynthesis [Paenibacillus sp. PvP052]
MTTYQVIWRGPVSKASGLGIASREYVLALQRQGVDVKVDGRSHQWTRNQSRTNTPITKFAQKPYAQNKRRVLIHHGPPSTINLKEERKRFDHIILNTVWETTKIPNQWLPNINKFDAVCVPSRHNKAAMRNSGVKIPIFIVPHGVHSYIYTPKNRKIRLIKTSGKFTFVSVFGFQHRKNPEALLRAYWKEFSPADRVALVIKTNGYSRTETANWIKNKIHNYKKKLGIRKPTAPIAIIAQHLRPQQLKGIYTLGSAFVLPTRGEGVGLPFLESLSSGVPVITTGWGGHMDFLHSGNSFFIRYQLKPPAISMNSNHAISRSFRYLFAQKGQRWAEADIQSLQRQMRLAYQNPGLCKQKGRQGRKDMLNRSWSRAGFALKQAIEKVIRIKKQRSQSLSVRRNSLANRFAFRRFREKTLAALQ